MAKFNMWPAVEWMLGALALTVLGGVVLIVALSIVIAVANAISKAGVKRRAERVRIEALAQIDARKATETPIMRGRAD